MSSHCRGLTPVGCTRVQRVGGRAVLGADVIGCLPDGRKLVVPCGSPDLQKFNTTARSDGADVGLFVASCVFTRHDGVVTLVDRVG
ncbi:hypothetical protein ACFS5L_15915 [Streptomyces phyllanthi]|uniref:hypothetical protein n=1 Tax=Streptomyces phyllanthi TaxID=1803180 RepID=UPI002AD462D5|nr:hypothetical protein [Streptomyces phyllanthi]